MARGAGLSPQPDRPGLFIIYRDKATAAGQGTALQIDDHLIEADPWPEISSPPYFIAHRGSYVEGMALGLLSVGSESWSVSSFPSELKEGEQWILTNANNHIRRLKIASREGDEITIMEDGADMPGLGLLNLIVRITPEGLALRSILLKDNSRFMRIGFKPDLNPGASAQSREEVAFQVDTNDHPKVLQGSITLERKGNTTQMRWLPKSPDSAKSHVLNASLVSEPKGYRLDVAK